MGERILMLMEKYSLNQEHFLILRYQDFPFTAFSA
jgi:hypothetical protein